MVRGIESGGEPGGGPVIALCAGEASGDKLAAELARGLKSALPQATLYGVGGKNMAAAGVEIVADCKPLSVMGYVDAICGLPAILRLRRRFLRRCAQMPPDVFVGIDAPDFNLGVARYLRARGAVCVQYVAPSVWMWRRGRLPRIAQAVHAVLCILPFEKPLFAAAGIQAHYVGHAAARRDLPARAAARARLGVADGARAAAVLPGSRKSELARHLPILQEAARLLPDVRLLVAVAGDAAATQVRDALPQATVGELDDVLAAADVALAKSGTVALEAALAGAPLLVFYRASSVAAFAARLRRFHLPFFCLPNILSGRFVATELLLEEASGENIAACARQLLEEEDRRAAQLAAFARMREALRARECSAAEAVVRILRRWASE